MKSRLQTILVLFVITTSLCKAQNPILWGMTSRGGTEAVGNIFQTNSNGSEFQSDFYFYSQTCYPSGNLIETSSGLLYGMTPEGGANNEGMIFSYNILSGIETELYDFGSGADGKNPNGSLIQASSGLLYGMTGSGGANNDGIIFSYDISTGNETDIHDFGRGFDGVAPQGSLIQVSDTTLYGMTVTGGADGDGIIFSYNISTGAETDLYDFGSGSNGQNPHGSLIQASNSLLYGMTQVGGANGEGTIFSYDIIKGKEIKLHDFGSGDDGSYPYGSLMQAGNGLLYGTTAAGGAYGVGSILSYNISTGAETDIYDFGSGTDGVSPIGSVIQASNGLLYGMTQTGGVYNYGMIFSYNISTGTEIDVNDLVGSNGEYPTGDLLEDDSPSANNNGGLVIFPNPSSGQFTIEIQNFQSDYSVDVYNVLGEKLYQFILNSSPGSINLSALHTGVYILYFVTVSATYVTEVLIAK